MQKLLLFLLIFTSLSLFAEQREGESDEDYKKRRLEELGIQVKESKPEPTPEENSEDSADNQMNENGQMDPNQDLEGSVDQAVEDLAGMGGMGKDGEPMGQQDSAPVKPVEIKESFLTKMMDDQTKQFLGTMMAKSPFEDMKRETIEQVFIARNEGNPLGSFLKNNEKPRNILIDVLKDKKALPQIVGLVNKPEKIKYMGIFAAVVLGMAFFANLMNSKGGIVKRVLTKFAIGAVAGSLNLGFFVFQFYEDLKPVINIVFKYYHL